MTSQENVKAIMAGTPAVKKSFVQAFQGFAYRIDFRRDEAGAQLESATVVIDKECAETARYFAYDVLGDIEIEKTTYVARVATKYQTPAAAELFQQTSEKSVPHDPIFDTFKNHIGPGEGYFQIGKYTIHEDAIDDFLIETLGAKFSRARVAGVPS